MALSVTLVRQRRLFDLKSCLKMLHVSFPGCGFWTDRNDFFNRHFTPGSNDSDEPFVRGPLMEGFIRFWTFVIILQVCF